MQQPTIGARATATITVDGLTFKDLNGNGVLDPYEDWRLPVAERVADLVARMTLEEKAGLLLLTSHYMGGSPSVGDPEQGLLNTHDQWVTENRWAAESSSTRRFDPPVLEAAGTEQAINTYGLRYLIVRDNPRAPEMATWINAIQEIAEASRLGIPAVMVSNPRNHVTYAKLFGISEANSAMSIWPGELGLAATGDPALVEEFGRVAARQWRAQGITKGYMYMADIATEPRWTRVDGTFGEDPALAADLIAAVTRGFQGAELGTGSVSLTTKHFPGGGPRDHGSDPHFEHGRFQPYPTEGSLYRYHLPAFQAAIDAGTTSIMPYYATTINARSAQQLRDGRAFEEVGFAYDKYLITEVLRGELGFRGYVNSDTGITTGMPWGVESLTRPERFAKAIDAGVNAFAGDGNPRPLIDAVRTGLVDESALDTNVSYLLDEIYRLGLFEDPYVDPDAAAEVCADPQAQALADAAHRKSIVLLDNTSGVLPLAADQASVEAAPARLHLEVVTGESADAGSEAVRAEARTWLADRPGIEVADSLDDATHALLWLRPELSLMNDTPDTVLSLELGADNGVDVEHVLAVESRVPTVLVVHLGNPWILDRVAPGAAATVGAFGTLTNALLDVVTGVVAPSATLPITLPRDAAAVEGNASDVPGHEESEGYAYTDAAGHRYVFGYGLTAF